MTSSPARKTYSARSSATIRPRTSRRPSRDAASGPRRAAGIASATSRRRRSGIVSPRELFPLDRTAAAEHEDTRVVRVGEKHGVPRMAVHNAGERVEVGTIADRHPIPLDRRVELERLEEVARRAGKDRDAVGRGADFVGEAELDPFDVLLEALPRWRPFLELLHPAVKLLSEERPVVVLPAVVGLGVQIKAQDRRSNRLHAGETVESFGERWGRSRRFHHDSFRPLEKQAVCPEAPGTIESAKRTVLEWRCHETTCVARDRRDHPVRSRLRGRRVHPEGQAGFAGRFHPRQGPGKAIGVFRFREAWRKKDLDWGHYKEIYIAPWNTNPRPDDVVGEARARREGQGGREGARWLRARGFRGGFPQGYEAPLRRRRATRSEHARRRVRTHQRSSRTRLCWTRSAMPRGRPWASPGPPRRTSRPRRPTQRLRSKRG